MNINKNYPCKSTNYRKGRRDKIKYIVIHYVGATGSALNNVKYYGSADVGASAHYYVGHASENGAIYQSVAPENCAWHCGSETGKYYSECRNDSSIGIEMCCHKTGNNDWYFDDITIEKTIELTKWLMQKYNIDANHVLRHYDVTRKQCPAPFVTNSEKWELFKSRLVESEELNMSQLIYNHIDGVPEFARATIKKLVDKKILNGESNGLNLTYDMLRILVIIDRAGAFDK